MNLIINYLRKFRGDPQGLKLPARPSFIVILFSFVGAFIGISLSCLVSIIIANEARDTPLILGSMGAMAILVYGTVDAPLAQPRNLVVGNLISGFIGVTIQKIFIRLAGSTETFLWLKAGLAVSLSLVSMQITQSVHPPAGATAIIAVSGGAKVIELGFFYLILPVLLTVSILLVVALLINNFKRQYPRYWWDPEKSLFFLFSRPRSPGDKTIRSVEEKFDLDATITSAIEPTLDELKEHIAYMRERINLLENQINSR